MKIYLDVESAGLKGNLHLIQYSKGQDSEIKIIRCNEPSNHDNFKEILELLNDPETCIIGYNIGFDLYKLYTFFKPKKAFKCSCIDLWQHVITSPPLCFYPLLGKSVIRINKIPVKYEEKLQEMIESKMKEVLPPLAIINVKRSLSECKELVSLAWNIKIPAKLKGLINFILPKERTINFDEVLLLPKDLGFEEETRFPYIQEYEQKNYKELWLENEKILNDPSSLIWQYAKKDISYLWVLESWINKYRRKYNLAEITEGYNDSCTHAVAYTKYHGFPVDKEKAKELFEKYTQRIKEIEENITINLQSPPQRLELIKSYALIPEMIISTDRRHLEILMTSDMLSKEGLEKVKMLLEYKPLTQRIKQLEVIKETGMVYPDFQVLGTSTNRMRGRGGLNFQGIGRDGEIRELFLCSQGGDFDNLEVTIAAQVFNDQKLNDELAAGLDLHTKTASLLFAEELNNLSYDELMKVKENPRHELFKTFKDYRHRSKGINFAILYFAGYFTLAKSLKCTEEQAEERIEKHFFSHYSSLKKTRDEYARKFCTADFDGWSKNSVSNMANSTKNLFGNTRYICLEKFMASWFWENSEKIANIAKDDEGQILRSELKGKQPFKNAIRSACLGAASGIQKSVYRQLGNYPIQSSGAILTKMLMSFIWEKYRTPIMNVHDELDIPKGYEHLYKEVEKDVNDFVEYFRSYIPNLKMSWKNIKTWGEK